MSDGGTTSPAGGGPAAGWYPDPQGAKRWWDGSAWTAHVTPAAASATPTHAATALATAAPAPGPAAAPEPGRGAPPGSARSLAQTFGSLSPRTWLVVAAVAAVVALLAGYLLFGRGSDDASGVAGTSPVSPRALVNRVALTSADLKGGLKTALVKGGDQVQGQVTLALCGYPFTSESHRVARRQVEVLTAAGQRTGLLNEVVVYDSAAGAAKAFAELRAAASHCPNRFVVDPGRGKPAVHYSAVKIQAVSAVMSNDPSETFDEGLTLTFAAQVQGVRTTAHELAVVVRRGALLDCVWYGSVAVPNAATTRTVGAIADVSVRKIPAG